MSAVKKNKTHALVFALAIASALSLSAPAFAQTPPSPIGPAGNDALQFLGETAQRGGLTDDPNAATDPTDIVAAIINTVLGLVGIIFFVQMFYAGFRWMTSGGSEEIIKESKGTIRSAIIGIVIVFSAFVLTNFVLNRLQGVSETTAAPTAPAATAPGG